MEILARDRRFVCPPKPSTKQSSYREARYCEKVCNLLCKCNERLFAKMFQSASSPLLAQTWIMQIDRHKVWKCFWGQMASAGSHESLHNPRLSMSRLLHGSLTPFAHNYDANSDNLLLIFFCLPSSRLRHSCQASARRGWLRVSAFLEWFVGGVNLWMDKYSPSHKMF